MLQSSHDIGMQIIDATSPEHFAVIRELFIEYANAIETDLCFQNFQEELASLPGRYAPPRGRLVLAFAERSANRTAAGCVGLRPFDEHICEMKRLYVRPAFRGQHLGRTLALAVIDAARQAGYAAMRLDTLASMREAQGLYRSLGFAEIPQYCHNPNSGVIFMELPLNTSRQTVGNP